MASTQIIQVNGRDYPMPTEPVVVVCVDGSEPAYHEQALAAGRMPYLAKLLENGTGAALTADCVMPSFTNPNNLSIATGRPPSVHGICGNYFFDRSRGEEVMMNEPEFLRAQTIFAAFASAGAPVAVITAKDKLRRLLSKGLPASSVCFSSEKLADAPPVYSAALSERVLSEGVAMLERSRPLITYLTLTDYIQHKYAPGTEVANDFYAMMDSYWARLDELGATLVVTADHGMNAKTDAAGTARVVYLQDQLDGWFGVGQSRTILPITDPYTVHHGALGSFAFVYLSSASDVSVARERLAALPGIETVLTRDEAVSRYELPGDRIGDLAVVAGTNVAVGTTPASHDLSALDRPLRSHGGLSEQRVPFLVNHPLTPLPSGHRLRNFDAYWVALNHA